MPVCQGCGSSYEDTFQFCPHCGRAKPEPQKISIEVDIARKTAVDDCPLCGDGSQVQKVSAIVASGTSKTNETTDIKGTTKVVSSYSGKKIAESESTGTAYTNSIHQNELAKYLSKPREPQKPSSVAWFPGCWTMAILAVAVYFFVSRIVDELPARIFDNDIALIAAGIVLFGLVFWGLMKLVNSLKKSDEKDRKANQDYENRLADYKAGLPVWDKLYYCHKHDVVFIPGSKDSERKEQAWQACVRWGKG